MHAGSRTGIIVGLLGTVVCGTHPAIAEPPSDVPAWLQAHIGEGGDQIAQVVLLRARALHRRKVAEGMVRNPCYFAMDATRPNDPVDDGAGGRFYVVCEGDRTFRAIPAGHGSGRTLPGLADFANGRACAKNFGNAMDSELTAGGAYLTAEARASFKGYYRLASSGAAPLVRTFLQFEGEGETANARQRAIGGHAAVTLKGLCLRHAPGSPYANRDGDVPYRQRVDYAGGRSNGCTSWSASDADQIMQLVERAPTTLYIYPASGDVAAVAKRSRRVARRQASARTGTPPVSSRSGRRDTGHGHNSSRSSPRTSRRIRHRRHGRCPDTGSRRIPLTPPPGRCCRPRSRAPSRQQPPAVDVLCRPVARACRAVGANRRDRGLNLPRGGTVTGDLGFRDAPLSPMRA